MAFPRASVSPDRGRGPGDEDPPPALFPAVASWRAGALAGVFLAVTLVLMPYQALLLRFAPGAARRLPHRYHRFVARLFGLNIRVIGAPVTGEGVLLLANHTSWLDIVLFSAVCPLSFIAKAEVARWPLFGSLARLQRTVFVERARRTRTAQVTDEIAGRLLAGDCLVLFPEGTSHDGNTVLAFKSALLGAVETLRPDGRHVMVQPVSAAFVGLHGLPLGRDNRPLFAWYGDMELLPHLWEALKAGPLDVVVQFHDPMSLDGTDRKQLAARAQTQVREGLTAALAGRL